MRTTIRKLVERLDKAHPFPEPIYEFGAYMVAGQASRSIRPLFSGREYLGCDLRPGPGVDRVLDLEKLALPDESVGSAIALDTFEHVERFWMAVSELHRVLKPGGVALLTSVMYFPIHNFPSDYWRFTPEGFRTLAQKFDPAFVEFAGLRDFPHTVVLFGAKRPLEPVTQASVRAAIAEWKRKDAQGWREWMTLVLPPALLVPLYRMFSRLTSRG